MVGPLDTSNQNGPKRGLSGSKTGRYYKFTVIMSKLRIAQSEKPIVFARSIFLPDSPTTH